jgi:hypothetical protein
LLACIPLAVLGACGEAGGPSATCNRLDENGQAQATLKAYALASSDLRNSAFEVEAKFKDACNAMSHDLGLDDSKATAQGACAVLRERVQEAVDAGAHVVVDVEFNCQADLSVQADCDAACPRPVPT